LEKELVETRTSFIQTKESTEARARQIEKEKAEFEVKGTLLAERVKELENQLQVLENES